MVLAAARPQGGGFVGLVHKEWGRKPWGGGLPPEFSEGPRARQGLRAEKNADFE